MITSGVKEYFLDEYVINYSSIFIISLVKTKQITGGVILHWLNQLYDIKKHNSNEIWNMHFHDSCTVLCNSYDRINIYWKL